MTRSAIHLLAGMGLLCLCCGADWLQFRGTDNTGVANGARLPTSWSQTENVAWKAPVAGRGVSGPIVVGNQVIVTASSGYRDDRLHVLSFDVQTGELQWERQFWATGRTLHHPTSAVAAPTPASDGKFIYAFYSSNDLICLDLEGNLKWLRGLTNDYPTAANDVGMSSSPVVIDGTVVVQVESQGESFAAGIDAANGQTRWQVPRAKTANWCSPCVMLKPRHAVILQSPDKLTAHDPATGTELWSYVAPCAGIPSPVATDGKIYVPSAGLTVLRPPASESETAAVVWQENRLGPGSASPVVSEERLFVINRAGVLVSTASGDGQGLWQLRLSGTYWATPVLAGKHLYCVNENGVAQVIEVGAGEGKLLATCDFGEQVFGSPAVDGGALYFRAEKHLWKVASPDARRQAAVSRSER